MKIVVVTALIGPAESPPLPGPAAPGVRYVCVTDRPEVEGWERWPAPCDADPRRAARRAKMSLSEWFADADATIWQDASFDLVVAPSVIVGDAKATECRIVGFRHPDRNCVEAEAAEIIRLQLAERVAVERQLAFYRSAGFDPGAPPLTTTGLLVRFRAPKVAAFNDVWWRQIATFTLRDQLSVDYAAWRAGIRIGYLPGHYRENRYARYNRERHRQRRAA